MDSTPSSLPVEKAEAPQLSQSEPESFSPEPVQLEFEPSSLASGPISVSEESPDLSSSKTIPSNIVDLIGFQIFRDLKITCEPLNRLDNSSLKTLASAKNPDRATAEFIADAIEDDDKTCLWLNTKFSLKGHNIPKGLSIHLFASALAEKILSRELITSVIQGVHTMIIQASELLDSHLDIDEFIEILFSRMPFKSLKGLMLYGIQFSDRFSQMIGKLKLKIFYMAKFSYDLYLAPSDFFRYCDTLEGLYVVYPEADQDFVPPANLKKLVVYCPESSEDAIKKKESSSFYSPTILTGGCHALKEV
jgi:hypothetical protein